jgi:hypothetical protein
MTVLTTSTFTGPYAPNGSTTAFPFTFRAMTAGEVKVVRRNSATGIEQVLAGYTVTLSSSGGTVTFGTAPGAGDPIYILPNPDFTQQTNFPTQGSWSPTTMNVALDRDAVRDIYLKGGLERSVRAPQGQPLDELPITRALHYLAWDAAGHPANGLSASEVAQMQSVTYDNQAELEAQVDARLAFERAVMAALPAVPSNAILNAVDRTTLAGLDTSLPAFLVEPAGMFVAEPAANHTLLLAADVEQGIAVPSTYCIRRKLGSANMTDARRPNGST